jgi:hypothetical protein
VLPTPGGFWVRNDSGEEVPEHGAMAVVGSSAAHVEELGGIVLLVDKPSATFVRRYLPNGDQPIAEGDVAFVEMPEGGWRFLYEASSPAWTPATGDSGGPKPGSWKLFENYPAITLVDGVVDATNKILIGSLREIGSAIGKTTGAVTGGTSATTAYRFYTTVGGIFSGADAGFTTVPDGYSKVDIDSGLFIKITPMGDVCLLEPLECNA